MLCKERVPVSIFLLSGIKLVGEIESYDPYVVLLKGVITQAIYKHAISTVVPSRRVGIPFSRATNADVAKTMNQEGATPMKALRTDT